jgi:murein DD-endopeptidase MepM/ murein hydrolase activator NlpD
VRLDHSQGMVSIYGHLSQIATGLNHGESVSLGEVIGRVGTSGLSTGPHLHFALERDGHYINPLTENIGVNHQVSPRMRSLFDEFKDNYLAMLSKLPDLGGHFHVNAPTSQSAEAGTGQAAAHLAGEQGSRRRSRHHWHSWRTAMAP